MSHCLLRRYVTQRFFALFLFLTADMECFSFILQTLFVHLVECRLIFFLGRSAHYFHISIILSHSFHNQFNFHYQHHSWLSEITTDQAKLRLHSQVCPVCKYGSLTEYEVVGLEELSDGSSSDRVHGAWLEVDQHRARHVANVALVGAGLVEVDVDPLQLQIRRAIVEALRVEAVLVGTDLPELTERMSDKRSVSDYKPIMSYHKLTTSDYKISVSY